MNDRILVKLHISYMYIYVIDTLKLVILILKKFIYYTCIFKIIMILASYVNGTSS